MYLVEYFGLVLTEKFHTLQTSIQIKSNIYVCVTVERKDEGVKEMSELNCAAHYVT